MELEIKHLSDYLSPLSDELQSYVNASDYGILLHANNGLLLDTVDVAIVSADVLQGNNCDYSDLIRKNFYKLFFHKKATILDSGYLKKGKTHADTVRCLQDVYCFFVKYNIPVILLGGSNFIPVYLSNFQYSDNYKSLTIVSNKLGVEMDEGDMSGFVVSLLDQKTDCFISHIGSQIYQNQKDSFDFYATQKKHIVRLGIARENIKNCEPLFRDSQFHLFDLEAIKNADMPAQKNASPNGFYAEEFCQLAWFSGVSDCVSLVVLSNYFRENDKNEVASILSAQVIWHIVDGLLNRSKITPFLDEEKFEMYVVTSDNLMDDLVFFKGENNRWWMKIYDSGHVKYCACAENDYETARNNNLPDVWVRHL